jgi:hypothetical protein
MLCCPSGRVPHVCTGTAGALHGLNKMGRSPFRWLSFPCREGKEREEPIARRAERCARSLGCAPNDKAGWCFQSELV